MHSQPNRAEARGLVEQAERFRKDGKPGSARVTARRALELDRENPHALHLLARLSFEAGHVAAAADYLRRAIDARPDSAEHHLDLVNCLRALQRHEEAALVLRRALELGADDAFAWHTLGSILADLGRTAEAEEAFRTAIRRQPTFGYAWYGLAQVSELSAGGADFAAVEALLERSDLRRYDRAHLHFALGRAWEAAGDHERSFGHFCDGNAIMRELRAFDARAELENARRIEQAFTRDVFASAAGGSSSELPVFIVGMPRSGSTLVEQILDSHPQVHGAGEVNYLWRTLGGIGRFLPAGGSLPEAIGAVQPQAWPRLAAAYLEKLAVHAPAAERIVDKLLFNYTMIGMIRLMFPRARIIHCVRDPLDTCVSCFTTAFANDRGFTNSLEDLGATYRAYRQLMRHWHTVLPGAILDVSYESLVVDLEGGARRLIDHLGLDWSEACLGFHRNPRAVGTASNSQVRKPAYRSSIGRWRRFEPHLGPLRAALGDVLDERGPA